MINILQQWFSVTNIIVIFLALNFIMMSINFGVLIQYGKIGEQYDTNVNATNFKIIQKADRNYLASIQASNEAANASRTAFALLQFLNDSFGPDSGYLEKENFQYAQANATYASINASEKNIIGNITDHRVISNQSWNKIFEKLGINERLEE